MSKLRVFLKYWLIVIAWMALIFTASSDTASFQRSSRILAPVVRWLFPHLPEDTVFEIVTFIRKCAHFSEYAILALLVWRGLRKPQKGDPRPWSWGTAGLAFLVVLTYAASDEIHQAFVPSRQASAVDVLLDSSGGFVALILFWAVVRLRGQPRQRRLESEGERSVA